MNPDEQKTFLIADVAADGSRTLLWASQTATSADEAIRKHAESVRRQRFDHSSHGTRLREEGKVRFAVAPKDTSGNGISMTAVRISGIRFYDVSFDAVNVTPVSA